MAHDPDQLFNAEQAAEAAGTTTGTLRAWLQRGTILPGDGDKPANGSGYYHFFSLNRVVQLALAVELVAFGLPTRRAGMLAAGFTDVGNTPGDGPDAAGETREPGALYTNGRTVLIAHEGADVGRVVCVRPGTPVELLFNVPGAGPRLVACMVDVNAVVRRVRAALDVAE